MQTQVHEQLSLSDAEVILLRLPERIRAALISRAAEIEYPIEAVVEMAISIWFKVAISCLSTAICSDLL